MIKPVYTQKDFREGKVGIKFEGNRCYLRKIIDVCSKPIYKDDFVNKLEVGQIVSVKEDEAIFLYTLDYLNSEIPFVPEHEIYLTGTDIPKDEKGFPLKFWGGRDNSGDITSSQYYLIYQKKNCILNAVKSDDFIEFCKQLKIAKVKEKHIVEHNLSSDSLEKAFRFILPPKKKIGFRKFSLDLLENDEVRQKALKADELGFEYPQIERVGKFHLTQEQPIELHGIANIAKSFQAPENIKEEDLQFDRTRTHEYVSPLRIERIINKTFIIKRQPQFFVTDSVVEYSKLITKFTPEAITAMVEDGFLEVTQKYIPGKCR